MRIHFDEFMHKAGRMTGCSSQAGLAKLLGVNRSAVTQAKNRDVVPEKWLLILARKFALSPDWFENEDAARKNPATLLIPRLSAVLCAGGGSLETEGAVLERIPLPFSLARSLGQPHRMVFMDVSGDSMEPGIHAGDTVLIDQSVCEAPPSSVMAVGQAEHIYLKRIRKEPGGIALLSDNPAHSPVRLAGDELDSFRIFGKVVYLFRNLT